MELKINNEDIEFEFSRSTKNSDVILGINIKNIDNIGLDVMTISICLDDGEFHQLKKLLED